MGNNTQYSNRYTLVLSFLAALFLTACSDDSNNRTATADNSSRVPVAKAESPIKQAPVQKAMSKQERQHYRDMDTPIDKANWTEKGKFRKEFTADCVGRELQNAEGKVDRAKIEKNCECIAHYMDDHLTDQEADEYLKEDNHTRSLQIRFEAGAFYCLQKNSPDLKGKITIH